MAAPLVRRPSSVTARRGGLPVQAVVGLAGLALLGAGIVLSMTMRGPADTVGDVKRRIADVARTGAAGTGGLGDDLLGPWRLRASKVDEASGIFEHLVIEQGDVVITAVRATLVIDAEADTFAFDLEDVTYVRAAETRPGDPPADGTFERLDSHLLGPAPWGRDIVPGAARPRPDKVTPPPARPRDRMREDADEPTRTRPERDRDDGGGVSGLIGG